MGAWIPVPLSIRNVSYKFAEKPETRSLCSINSSIKKSCLLWDNVEKYGGVGEVTADNIPFYVM